MSVWVTKINVQTMNISLDDPRGKSLWPRSPVENNEDLVEREGLDNIDIVMCFI